MAWWNDGSALANSLVAYWKLDESSGSRADSVGANTLTDNNTVTSNTGRVNPLAAEFLAANGESLSIADNVALSMADIQMFFGGWVYLTAKSAIETAFGKTDNTGNQRSYFVQYDNTTDRFSAGFNPTGSGSSTQVAANSLGSPALNTWYFILAWHDSVANTISISINGREPDSVAYTTGIFDGTAPFRIGASQVTAGNFWSGRIGPVFVGKGYIPTVQNRIDMLKEAPSLALDKWWLGNSQILAGNVKEHVELPNIGQAYAGAAVASGQPWSVAVKSFSYLASANLARYLFDSQTGRFTAGINTSAQYGFYNGTTWVNPAIFATAQEQIWFFVSNDLTIQAYLNNVAVGSASASSIGLGGLMRWASNYDGNASFWNNPILYGAVYDISLDAVERDGLYRAMLGLNTNGVGFAVSGSWVAPAGVTVVDVIARGPGGSGNDPTAASFDSGGGGGGGAYAASTGVAVTPGNTYTVTVGAGGSQVASRFVADSESVVGAAGGNGNNINGGGGGQAVNSVGDIVFSGGSGGAGTNNSANQGGGGGGGSAGSLGNGGVGAHITGGSGGAFGAGGAGGGANGGAGGNGSIDTAGNPGSGVGGGGGGAPSNSATSGAGAGFRGQVNINWVYLAPPSEVVPDSASAIGAVVAPTAVKGSVTPTVTTDDAVGSIAVGTVVLGSVSITPGAVSSTGTTTGEVVQGDVNLAPNAIAGQGETIAPSVVRGAISLVPSATGAVSDVAAPTVVRGPAVAAPAPASAFVRTTGGFVSGSGATLSLDPVDAQGLTVGPVVRKGSITAQTSPAQALAGQVNPVVIKGGMALAPVPATAWAARLAPTVIKGAVLLEFAIATAYSDVAGIALVGGSTGLLLAPDPAVAMGEVAGPTQAVVGLFETASKQMFAGIFKGMH